MRSSQPAVALVRACIVLALGWAAPARSDPTIACPGGPDPLRFQPERPIALLSGDPDPLAISACTDRVGSYDLLAIALLDPAGQVVVMVSGDYGCSFRASTYGMPPTAVTVGPITARPAVAVRSDAAGDALAVSWREGDAIVVATATALDGTFTAPVTLETNARSAPVLAWTAAPSLAVLGAAWIAETPAGARVLRFATNASSGAPGAWSAATTLDGALATDLGGASGVALSADAAGLAGAGGFTLLATVTTTGRAISTRSDDAGASFAPWRLVDDASLVMPMFPSLAAVDGDTRAWTGLAWAGRARVGPPSDRVVADADLADAGALVADFDGATGAASPVQSSSSRPSARTAVAAMGLPPDPVLHVFWEEAGEIYGARRPLATTTPRLQGGCGAFRVTGLSPVRMNGSASAPVAAVLRNDVYLAYVDTRGGTRQAWLKRSDSVAPVADTLAAAARACGEPPSVDLTWNGSSCDLASMIVEISLTSGATDYTRPAPFVSPALVEGLEPGTTYYFRLRATDLAGNVTISNEVSATTPSCSGAYLRTSLLGIFDSCASGGAGGDGFADPGETMSLQLRVENVGGATAPAVVVSALSRSPFVTLDGSVALGDVAVGAPVDFTVGADVSATAGCVPLEILLRSEIAGAQWSDLVLLPTNAACTTCRSASCSVTADASATSPTTFCQGFDVTLDAGRSVAGNCAGRLLYEWYEDGTLVSTQMIDTRRPGSSVTYRLVARCSTDFDCMDETTVGVTVLPLPNITFAEDPPPPHCAGAVVMLTALTTDPAARFDWDGGGVPPDPTIFVTTPGVHDVLVTDSNGCQRTRSFRVDFGVVPPADAGPDVSGCGAQLIGTPGFPLLDYRWDPPDGLSSTLVAQPVAAPATPTTYTLTVTDPTTGCRATDSVAVDVTPGPGPIQDLRVRRAGTTLTFTWTAPPDALATRVYSDTDAELAAHANATSATARLECEGLASGNATVVPPALVFYQAVARCLDGVHEGPN
jgi:hypothetical protein